LLHPASLGQANASGTLNASVPTPDLPAGSLHERRFSQVAVRGSGLVYLGSGAVLYLLDRQSGPDCNGNGVSDLVDVLEGASADANHNLIPDRVREVEQPARERSRARHDDGDIFSLMKRVFAIDVPRTPSLLTIFLGSSSTPVVG
jgi:hypothetical protein